MLDDHDRKPWRAQGAARPRPAYGHSFKPTAPSYGSGYVQGPEDTRAAFGRIVACSLPPAAGARRKVNGAIQGERTQAPVVSHCVAIRRFFPLTALAVVQALRLLVAAAFVVVRSTATFAVGSPHRTGVVAIYVIARDTRTWRFTLSAGNACALTLCACSVVWLHVGQDARADGYNDSLVAEFDLGLVRFQVAGKGARSCFRPGRVRPCSNRQCVRGCPSLAT